MSMLSHLLDASKLAKLSDAQVAALNQHLELALANEVMNTPALKTKLADEVKKAAAGHN